MPSLPDAAGRALAARERWEAVDAAVAALRVTRSSGEVEVTVDGRGALVDVRFSPRFRSVEAAVLAASVLRALGDAQAVLPDRVAELVGSSDDAAAAVVEGYRRRFPAPPSEPPPPSPHTWLR